MPEEKQVLNLPSIGFKSLGFTKKELQKLVDGKKEKIFIARVGGVVAEAFSGTGVHGVWWGMKGIFSLITKDGDKYVSTVTYLPTNITNQIREKLDQGQIEVEFAADIYVAESEKSGPGYAFLCETIMSEDAKRKADAITSRVFESNLPTQPLLAGPSTVKTIEAKATKKSA